MCEGKIIKYVLLFFNFIKFLLGAAVLGVGIWMAVDNPFKDFQAIVEDLNQAYWDAILGIIITTGCLLLIVGFLGCCGAIRESKGMLIAYTIVLMVIVVAVTVAIILLVVFKGDLIKYLDENMENQVKNEYVNETSTDGVSESWNYMMKDLACCGKMDYRDWNSSIYAGNYPNNTVPYTCCKWDWANNEPENLYGCRNEAYGYTDPAAKEFHYLNPKGCYDALVQDVSDNEVIFYAVLGSVLGVLVLAMVLACVLVYFIGDSEAV